MVDLWDTALVPMFDTFLFDSKYILIHILVVSKYILIHILVVSKYILIHILVVRKYILIHIFRGVHRTFSMRGLFFSFKGVEDSVPIGSLKPPGNHRFY